MSRELTILPKSDAPTVHFDFCTHANPNGIYLHLNITPNHYFGIADPWFYITLQLIMKIIVNCKNTNDEQPLLLIIKSI